MFGKKTSKATVGKTGFDTRGLDCHDQSGLQSTSIGVTETKRIPQEILKPCDSPLLQCGKS